MPTAKEVLLCYLAHLKELSSRNAANDTAQQVTAIFCKARIPVLQIHKVAEEVIKTHDNLLRIGKIPKNQRDGPKEKERIHAFKESLTKTFKAWPRNCLERIELEEDKLFFKSMLTDRQACMLGVDKNLSDAEIKRKRRRENEQVALVKQFSA